MLRVRSAVPLEGRGLRLLLTDGTTIERDVTDLLWGPVFDRLRTDDAFFRRVRARYGTVTWPGNLDIAPRHSSGTELIRRRTIPLPSGSSALVRHIASQGIRKTMQPLGFSSPPTTGVRDHLPDVARESAMTELTLAPTCPMPAGRSSPRQAAIEECGRDQ